MSLLIRCMIEAFAENLLFYLIAFGFILAIMLSMNNIFPQ